MAVISSESFGCRSTSVSLRQLCRWSTGVHHATLSLNAVSLQRGRNSSSKISSTHTPRQLQTCSVTWSPLLAPRSSSQVILISSVSMSVMSHIRHVEGGRHGWPATGKRGLHLNYPHVFVFTPWLRHSSSAGVCAMHCFVLKGKRHILLRLMWVHWVKSNHLSELRCHCELNISRLCLYLNRE